jgi:hypothetical protein
MNRIDTIVAALEFASDNSDKANFEYHIVEKALAAARELKELKPVAWLTTEPFAQTGISITTVTLHQQMSGTPLYALDEVTHD